MRVCPFCGTDNEVFFRFCLGCGADLDDALGPPDADAAPTVAPPPAKTRPKAQRPKPAPEALKPPPVEEPLPTTMVRRAPAEPMEPSPRRRLSRQTPERNKRANPKAGSGQTAQGRLVLILEDGTDGAVYDLGPETTVIGREGADINFPHDDFLAPRHAQFSYGGSQLTLEPLESTNGVFVQVSHEVELRSGDVFRIGQELLCFELLGDVIAGRGGGDGAASEIGSPVPEGAWGRLGQLVAPNAWGAVYLLGGSDIYLGRERGDITFPGDGFVSGLHAVVMQRDDRYFLKDLGSSNGTYFRLTRSTPLRGGALVLAGQQLFRVER
ncbi:MAG: hypothetical protein CSA66_05690 [Proteobacteria bacterium]|nr:MAG: hypothetical protein CSA66_05690 [Pseudomonadota bacterium]